MTIQPINDRLLVKRVAVETKTKGGLFLPEVAVEPPPEGVIMAVGPGRLLEDGTRQVPSVKEGDRVLFGSYSGVEVFIEGEPFLILREEDIVGILC